MPFLNKKDRDTVKALLNDVMSDADLKDQYNKAKARREGVVSDHTDAMLCQYIEILKEISAERDANARPKADAVAPDLGALKKNKSRAPKNS